MAEQIIKYRVFIASPEGLELERRAFRDVIDEFNRTHALPAGNYFEPVGWEDSLGGVGRPQTLINDEVRTCDYFVLVLWDRWGSPPGGDNNFRSGSEEELELARACVSSGTMKQIVPLFKAVDSRQMSDAGPQLQQVLDFRRELETSKALMYDTFETTANFATKLARYLATWSRQSDAGPLRVVPLPTTVPEDLADLLPSEDQAKEAWDLANAGKLTDAEVVFAKLVSGSRRPALLVEYSRFAIRIGRLDQALALASAAQEGAARPPADPRMQAMAITLQAHIARIRGDLDQAEAKYSEALDINAKIGHREGMASQYGNLGGVLKDHGQLKAAERMYRRALEIDEELEDVKGMARDYGSLGVVMVTRGDLNGAESMHRKALELDRTIGHLEGMARHYGNLGTVLQKRGNLDSAEAMYRDALGINQKLGHQEGMARQYGNLGVVLKTRGNLDAAEEMHRKALEIDESLGRLEGVASQCGNLGVVLVSRGDLDGAELMYRKALAINEQLGRLEGMARQYGNLGVVLKKRNDLDGADAMYRKALAIDTRIGRLEGVANQYGNLGVVLQLRGELDAAEAMYRKAIEIDRQLGHVEGMARQYGNLGNLMAARGDLQGARACLTRAQALFQQSGAGDMAGRVQAEIVILDQRAGADAARDGDP